MLYLTYVLIKFYGMSKLIILAENISKLNVQQEENNTDKISVKTKNKDQEQSESIEQTKKKLKNIFLLEKCKDYNLEDDVYITIERKNSLVKYILYSNKTNLDTFLKQCIDKYKQDLSITEYKYTLKLTGYEKTSRDGSSLTYPPYLLGLCHALITKHNINNFRLCEINGKQTKIIEEVTNLKVDGLMINTIRSTAGIYSWDTSCCTTYVLESDTVNPTAYLEECYEEYMKYITEKPDDILYYFKYLGKIGNELKSHILFAKHPSLADLPGVPQRFGRIRQHVEENERPKPP